MSNSTRRRPRERIKIVETISPLEGRDIIQIQKKYLEKISHLFKITEFKNQVTIIRQKFNIPPGGNWLIVGINKRVESHIERSLRKQHKTKMVLQFDTQDLRDMKIKIKSRKLEFQQEVGRLRQKFQLPLRLQQMLINCVMYGGPLRIEPRLPNCLIHIAEHNGEHRIFLEIFGDTRKSNLIDAWETAGIEKLIEKYKLPGRHLFRFKGFYRAVGEQSNHSNLYKLSPGERTRRYRLKTYLEKKPS